MLFLILRLLRASEALGGSFGTFLLSSHRIITSRHLTEMVQCESHYGER